MRMLKVYEYATLEEARETTGRAPISVDWVDVDKGDDARPEYRSRLVAQETKWVTSLSPEDVYAVFAATPPLEALRFILSRAMTELKEDRSADRVIADCVLGHQPSTLAQPSSEAHLRQGLQGRPRLP